MQQLRVDILREFNTFRERITNSRIITKIAFFTGAGKVWATFILLLIVFELLIFLLFLPLHRKILKNLETAKKRLVAQIDEIIYSLAKTQYDSHISKKELGGDPHMAMMKEMFKSGSFEYLNNISIIKENVGKVELLLRKQVATPEQRDEVNACQKKMKRLIFWKNFLGYLITIFTIGIYKPFR